MPDYLNSPSGNFRPGWGSGIPRDRGKRRDEAGIGLPRAGGRGHRAGLKRSCCNPFLFLTIERQSGGAAQSSCHGRKSLGIQIKRVLFLNLSTMLCPLTSYAY